MSDQDVEVFLEHFGVKGMRWGIRNIHDPHNRELHITPKQKQKKPLTKAELSKRREKRKKIAVNAVRLASAALFIASILSSKGSTRTNNLKSAKFNANKSANDIAKDIINETRNVKLESLKRMHKEGKMDSTQAKNFIKIVNERYDRKIADAVKAGL